MAEKSIQEALQEFLKKSRIKNGIQAVQIEEVWAEMMGPVIAKYTEGIRIVSRKLFIKTTMAPLKNELMYQRETIIIRVNQAFGEKVIDEVIVQ